MEYELPPFDLINGRPQVDGYGLCRCGCGGKTSLAPLSRTDQRWVKGEPVRFLRGHHGRLSTYVARPDANGCIIWTAGMSGNGYGQVWVSLRIGARGAHRPAHRVVYEQRVGPIPEGMQLDHLCRVPLCVNPEHLEVVASAENVRRGERSSLSHAHVAKIREIIATPNRPSYREIGLRFGVHGSTICNIALGNRWRPIEAATEEQ